MTCLILLTTLVLAGSAQGHVQPVDLRCEYLHNPQGIDATHPRLSWMLDAGPAPARGERQTAWRVLVASSRSILAKDSGDLWDSGRVSTDQCTNVAYAGVPLRSGMECFWKVRVWDRRGKPSAWSVPAHPGFKHIVMHPRAPGDLCFVRATHRSPYGLILSAWRRSNGVFEWKVIIPPNATATLCLPAENPACVTESGRPLVNAPGVRFRGRADGCVVCEVQSGHYSFRVH